MKPHHYAHHCLAVYKDSMYYFANLRAVNTVLHNLLWTCDVQEQFANTISSVLWLMQKFVWSVQRSSPTPIIGSLYQCRTAERQSWHTSVTLQIVTGVYSLDFAVNRPYFTAVQHAPVFFMRTLQFAKFGYCHSVLSRSVCRHRLWCECTVTKWLQLGSRLISNVLFNLSDECIGSRAAIADCYNM